MFKIIHSVKCLAILTNPSSPSKITKDKLAKVTKKLSKINKSTLKHTVN